MFLVELFQKFIREGGFTAWFILFAGLALIVVGYERLQYLYLTLKPISKSSLDSLKNLILKRDYTSALQLCNSVTDAPDMDVVRSGLLAVESGREAMKSSLGSAIVEITRKCESRIQIIALIASVATLLGLLGTISGLIKTFAAIADADPATKGQLLGAGIAEAMTATAAGLIVGISAMVVHTLCVSKIDEVIGKAKKTGFDMITLIEQSERDI
jgi:biopolymer transport protein ExbB